MGEITEEDLHSLQYFWKEKGDIERWTGWENMIDRRPDIAIAWAKYLAAKREAREKFDAFLTKLSDELP